MTTPVQPIKLTPFEDQTDIGVPGKAGSLEYNSNTQAITLHGSGANIWRDQDSFHFAWKKMSGDFIVTAKAGFLHPGGHPQRKLGWMARTDLSPASPHVSAVLHGDGVVSLQTRRRAGASTEELRLPADAADMLQLERKGNTFSLSAACFGEPFTSVEVSEVDLGETVMVGLFVCAHNTERLESAQFENVRLVEPAGADFDRNRDPFGSRLELLDLDNGLRRIVHASNDIFEAPNWTRDGKALIYNAGGRLYRFDLKSREITPIDTGEATLNNNDHVLSFDGSRLAISSHSPVDLLSRIYTVPVEGGQATLVTPKGPSYLHGWSPDGKWLAYCAERNGQYDVYRISAEGGEEIQLTNTPGLDDGPEYTPDGRYIYFNSVRSGRMQIWRMRPDGSEPQQMTDGEYNNWFAHISSDGGQAAFLTYLAGEVEPGDHPAAKRVYLRLMPAGGGRPKVIAYLYGGQGSMNVPSWSPDGSQLAFVSNTVPFR